MATKTIVIVDNAADGIFYEITFARTHNGVSRSARMSVEQLPGVSPETVSGAYESLIEFSWMLDAIGQKWEFVSGLFRQYTFSELAKEAARCSYAAGFDDGLEKAEFDGSIIAAHAQSVRSEFASKRARLREAVLERDGESCRICGSTDGLSIDHDIPVSKGGTNDLDNLVMLCKSCNSRKGNRPFLQVV
jgi:hypothetical protein